jgi:hypothetical protein
VAVYARKHAVDRILEVFLADEETDLLACDFLGHAGIVMAGKTLLVAGLGRNGFLVIACAQWNHES